ncbi:neurobeachin-like protein, partial [Trifolium medium]|nr:neurobeachin-like protein [Trifolium medium]
MEEVWAMKKDLPDFTGINPVAWIVRAERFFEKNEIPSCDKLQWVFMSMEGEEAMCWFYYWCEENPDANWESFSMALIKKFGALSERSTSNLTLQNQESESKLLKVTETSHEPNNKENSMMKVIETFVEDGN